MAVINLLKTPLLPQNKVALVAISYEYPEIIANLKHNFNIEAIEISKNLDLEPAISSHADCVIIQLDYKTLLIDKSTYPLFVNNLTNRGIDKSNLILSDKPIFSPYPNDIKLNIKVIGDRFICNTNYVDQNVKRYAQKNNITLIHSNQGYSACSAIVLNTNALITDDESIYSVAQSYGIDCLKISKGSVKLNGHEYGFIGGTCGMIDKNLLAFTGKLSSHSDFNLIVNFLNKHNVNYVELSDNPLIDIGGIIPILENI